MNEPLMPAPPHGRDGERLLERLAARRRLPLTTYRLQLEPGFGFREAAALVPWLARLGVTECHCSPWFRARPGSRHGYDVCDYGRLNDELGSEAEFEAFAAALAEHGLGCVLDFVPNHMAVEPVHNRWWHDLLEHGRASPFARFFDVDWDPVKPELRGKVLLPMLGDHYGSVLERGELRLHFEDGALDVRCGGVARPIDPREYPRVLRVGLERLRARLAESSEALQELLSILTAFEHLPARDELAPERVAERLRESRLARERLARLVAASPEVRDHVEAALRTLNGEPGRPESFEALHQLLEAQAYRLACWKTAAHEINYRRFFDINQLVGLRMEDPEVFAATHALLLRLVRRNVVTGLRLDHVDGLFDPARYFERLQAAILEERAAELLGWGEPCAEEQRAALAAWRDVQRRADPRGPAARPLWIVAEKILGAHERLPPEWPIAGTTGYDFLNDVNRLFVDPTGVRALREAYARFGGAIEPFADVAYECKQLISWTALASELNVLAHALNDLSEGDRRARDFTLDSLREALREVAACFPVYRSYVGPTGASPADRAAIDLALRRARRRNPAMEGSIFDFVRDVLLPDAARLPPAECAARLAFAMRFQQYTAPLQAKGIEDTAFYRQVVLASLNEVGGEPEHDGDAVERFHAANARRLAGSPRAMLATMTHDAKRGEDARTRLDVLTELPDEWRRAVASWARINARCRRVVDDLEAPDRAEEWLCYQALLGCWPPEPEGTAHRSAPPGLVERVRDSMLKAVREAKVHTSWISPNEAWDRAVAGFVEEALSGPRAARFLAAFLPFQQRVARLGAIHSLAQVVLKVASPGVPDVYRGSELWDLSLVDPDNRRPVDFTLRRRLLDELEPWLDLAARRPAAARAAFLDDLLRGWHDGRVKLFVTACALRWRRRLAALFVEGGYVPLEPAGAAAPHVVAFARRRGDATLLAIVPRLAAKLCDPGRAFPVGTAAWGEATLRVPDDGWPRSFENVLTGEHVAAVEQSGALELRVADAFATFPVALLLDRRSAQDAMRGDDAAAFAAGIELEPAERAPAP